MQDHVFPGPMSGKAGAAVSRYRLVVRNSAGKYIHAEVGASATRGVCGTFQDACPNDAIASGDGMRVFPLIGQARLTANGSTIAVGDYLKLGAAGKVAVEGTATTPASTTLAQALEASSTDLDVILVEFVKVSI